MKSGDRGDELVENEEGVNMVRVTKMEGVREVGVVVGMCTGWIGRRGNDEEIQGGLKEVEK